MDEYGGVVGDDKFLEVTDDQSLDAFGGIFSIGTGPTEFQLAQEILVALDGARHDGREEDAEDTEAEGVLDGFRTVVDVGQVVDEFEREEGDGEGKGGGDGVVQQPDPGMAPYEERQRIEEESPVFVAHQTEDGDGEGRDENSFPARSALGDFREPKREEIGDDPHDHDGGDPRRSGEVVVEDSATSQGEVEPDARIGNEQKEDVIENEEG